MSLFTGIGGGLLGTKLLGWNHIGYVEWDKYCCRVLEQRIRDGILDDAPIWNIDIREFNKRYAEKYRGICDVITAGFPCQPFSVAGKRAGADDERNMWPATIECIRKVRPQYCLLENVPGLLTSGYFGTILGDLAESGYDCRWRCLSAAEMGANHKRNRLWILAYPVNNSNTRGRKQGRETDGIQEINRASLRSGESGGTDNVADTIGGDSGRGGTLGKPSDEKRRKGKTKRKGIQPRDGQARSDNIESSRQDVADTTRRTELQKRSIKKCNPTTDGKGETGRFTNDGESNGQSWWSVEPDLGRLAHGIPNRVERLRAIGNAQVPAVVRAVWRLLNDPA